MMFNFFLIVFVLFNGCVLAQHSKMHPDINIDTSYTINSAYKKYLKKYPTIEIAKTPNKNVRLHENITYANYGNRKMHLDLYSPNSKKKKHYPCVVLIHGGGWISGDKSLLKSIACSLANKGYIAISIEYRLSNEAKYPAALIDIYNALSWLNNNAGTYSIDTNKISILGSSAGAQLASLAGTTLTNPLYAESFKNWPPNFKLQSIINIDGVLAFIHPLSKEGTKPNSVAEKWFGEHYTKDSTKWIESSALTHVNKNTPPTLFIASKHSRFHAGREEMIAVLEKHNIYYEKHGFANAPHSFWLFEPWFKPTMKWILKFLKKVNKQ